MASFGDTPYHTRESPIAPNKYNSIEDHLRLPVWAKAAIQVNQRAGLSFSIDLELVESISGHKVTLFHFWSYRPTLPGIIMVDFTHPKP